MSDEPAGEKEHEASQKKLLEARRKGEIARSTDLTTAASYVGFLVAIVAFGASAVIAIGDNLRIFIEKPDSIAGMTIDGNLQATVGGVSGMVLLSLFPFFTLPAAFAILALISQKAFIFSRSKLAPKLDRISPLAGIKNKFGRQGIFEFTKSLIKLILYIVILGVYLFSKIDQIMATLVSNPLTISAELGSMVLEICFIVVVVAATLGIFDYLFQRNEHLRKNRMSRKELMDELKGAEGDPAMKQRRRQIGMNIATRQMLSDVPDASVVIVNPTHFAVALQWSSETGRAPICVAKGLDEVAARIREIAIAHAIPIHPDPVTARALHATVGIGEEIGQDYFQAVAIAIRFAQKVLQKARER